MTAPNWKSEGAAITTYPTAPSVVAAHSKADGDFAAAIGDNGIFITRASDGTWTSQTSPFPASTAAVLAVAPSPVSGNGAYDLFAISASDVQGSDDEGNSFDSLAPPAGGSLMSGAFLGAPHSQLLSADSPGCSSATCWPAGTGPPTRAH